MDIVNPETRATIRFRPGQRAVYRENHRSFGAFIRSEQMRDVTADVASDIARAASALTPASRAGAREHTGLHARVKAGYGVKREGGFENVAGNIRVKVLVENDEPGSAIVEYGGRGLDPLRPLGIAGAKFGDFQGELR